LSEIIKYSDTVLSRYQIGELSLEEFMPSARHEVTIEDVLQLKRDADRLYGDAQAKANKLLIDAEEKIKELFVQAQSEIEARQLEGYEKGYAAGAAKAESEVDKKYEKAFQEEFSQIREVIFSFRESYKDVLKKAETQLVKLSMDIARKVIGQEAEKNEAIVIAMIKEGLSRVVERANITVRINPAQLYVAEAHKKLIVSSLEGIDGFELREDAKVDLGGCIVETESGSVELRIEKQLLEVKKVLTGEDNTNDDVAGNS
jgi:flagellar assembly protein FliH